MTIKYGRIYFLTDGEAIKVGYTIDLSRRLSLIQDYHYFPLFLLGSIEGTRQTEQLILKRFQHLRIRGEWFWAEAEIIDFIDDLGEMGRLYEGDDLEDYHLWNTEAHLQNISTVEWLS